MAERADCFQCMRNQQRSAECPFCIDGKCHTRGARERVVVENPTEFLDGSERITTRLVVDHQGRVSVHKAT